MSGSERGRVLITGTSTGIGRACAVLLDRQGYRVFAGVRRVQDAESLRKEASERLVPVMLDITDARQIAEARTQVEASVEPESGLTGLLNCAGIMVAGALESLPLDRLRWQLEVNLIGQVAVTQAFLPLIRQGHGRIINIGSGNGRFAFPFMGAYAASSLRRLWRVPATAWLLRNRRYVGLSFAVAHAVHALAVLGLATLLGDAFEYDPVSLGFGGLAYVFVAALAATSSDRAVAALGPARWRRLHRIGVHYVWFVFAVTEIPVALHSPQHFALAGLVVGGAALRVAAARAGRQR